MLKNINPYEITKNLKFKFSLVCLLILGMGLKSTFAAVFVNTKFTETTIVPKDLDPTQFDIAPDGRIFICSKTGALRIVKNGQLLTKPFVSLLVNSSGEQGLLGVAFHPKFPDSPFVYVYYTMAVERFNRVSRFTANGDTALGNKETVIFDLDPLGAATNHMSGGIHFGNDGKLYISSGNNASPTNSQNINITLGKMLRVNADGTIPSDNPFLDKTTGNARANWTTGMRNTFTFAVDKVTGKIFGGDVGDGWEEVNDLIGGSNYGYGKSKDGYDVPTDLTGMIGTFRPAIYAWSPPNGAARGVVLGSAFYPSTGNRMFPSTYHRKFFFSDYNYGQINVTDIDNPKNVTSFATGAGNVTDIKFSPLDGSMYYVTRTGSKLMKVVYDTAIVVSAKTPLEKFHQSNFWRMVLADKGRIPWRLGSKSIDIVDIRGQILYTAHEQQNQGLWINLPASIHNGLYMAHYH